MRRKIKESFSNGKSKKQTATVRELKIKEVEQTCPERSSIKYIAEVIV